jgi:hypothetical protein
MTTSSRVTRGAVRPCHFASELHQSNILVRISYSEGHFGIGHQIKGRLGIPVVGTEPLRSCQMLEADVQLYSRDTKDRSQQQGAQRGLDLQVD